MTCKQGLDYFPHSCGNFDDNLEYILAVHGSDGYYIYFRLLEKIYSQEGYYMKADHKTLILYSSKINKDIKLIERVLNDLIKEGLFNQELYEKHQILTSPGIQKRFLEITKALRRKEIRLIDEYIIRIDAIYKAIDANINRIDVGINKQKKRKEKKGKERKVKYASSVLLTSKEYQTLIEKFGDKPTIQLIEKLNHYKESSGKKYKSDYSAIHNWVVDKVIGQKKQDPFENL